MRETPDLINGRLLKCPRCKKDFDVLQYNRLIEIPEFQSQTNPVYKCPGCRWIFSLSDNLIFEVLSQRVKIVPNESESQVS